MLKVSVIHAESYSEIHLKEAIVALLRPFGGMQAFAKAGERILLKPNMLSAKQPDAAVTTHPAMVKVVAELYSKRPANEFC